MHTYIMRIHPCQISEAGSWQVPNKLSSFTFLLMFSETDMEGQRAEGLNIFIYFSLQIVSFNGKAINGPNVSHRSKIQKSNLSLDQNNNLISICSNVLHIFSPNVFQYNSCLISPITRIVLTNFYSSLLLYPWDISAQLSIFSTKFYSTLIQ